MYLRARTNNAIPATMTARLQAPPIQLWNLEKISRLKTSFWVTAVGITDAGLAKQPTR